MCEWDDLEAALPFLNEWGGRETCLAFYITVICISCSSLTVFSPPPFILCESLSGEAADSKNTTLSRSTARSEELQNQAGFFFPAVAMRSVTIDPGS